MFICIVFCILCSIISYAIGIAREKAELLILLKRLHEEKSNIKENNTQYLTAINDIVGAL